MTNAAVGRPLREAHLAHETRLDPVMAAAGRRADVEGGGRARQRQQLAHQSIQRGLVEARTHLRDIDEAPAVVEAEVQRAEVGTRALRHRVAADDELLAALALDLEPVARASGHVAASHPLGDDALESLLGAGLEERITPLDDVIRVAHDAPGRHDEAEQRLALAQRQIPHIATIERERVEEDAGHRRGRPRALDLDRMREVHAQLQPLEARARVLVERDDLAVDEKSAQRQRAEGAHDLRIARGERLPLASIELDGVFVAPRQHAHTVVLDLEQPVGVREGVLAAAREHDRVAGGPHVARRNAQSGQARVEVRDAPGALTQLLHREPRQNRLRPPLGRLRVAGERVGLLQEEPVTVLARHAGQRPRAPQLDAEQLDVETPALELAREIVALERSIPPAVPHDDLAGAVVARRDHALEVRVLHGMILDVDGQALFLGVQRGTFWHGPAL